MPIFILIEVGSMSAKFAIGREKYDQIYYHEYKNDYCYPHFHSHIELYFVTDGEMEITINNRRRILKKDELGVSLSFDTHQYKTPKASASKVFIIPSRMADEFEALTGKQRAANPFICDGATVTRLDTWIQKINGPQVNTLEVKGCIYLILGELYRVLTFAPGPEQMETELASRILFYLEAHFREPVTLQTLAHSLGYSPSYLSKYFRNCFLIGFNQYLNLLRLRSAVTLMGDPRNSITFCAMESGFNSMRSFYRAFSNEFHTTPKKYLRRL